MNFDKAAVDRIIDACGRDRKASIPILQAVQQELRYLPEGIFDYVSERIGVSPAQLYGVATFYSQFRLEPVGEHLIKVCHGTACHVADAKGISEAIGEMLGVPAAGGTTDDKRFTLESVACLGCCSLAPVMMIDDTVYGKLTRAKIKGILTSYRRRGPKGEKVARDIPAVASADLGDKAIATVLVGLGSCGVAAGARSVYDHFDAARSRHGLEFDLKKTGCCGLCHREPLVELVARDGTRTVYGEVDAKAAQKILEEHVGQGRTLESHHLELDSAGHDGHAFFAKQQRVVLENCGRIDPESIEEYIAADGYTALETALAMQPAEIIETVRASGLRGRGGAGFSTGLKWQFAAQAPGDEKYVVCNADEGDPGAFMDRSVLESDPHRILEGMTIAAYAIGARHGYIYCRAEYPLAVKRLTKAIADARAEGVLGDNIRGSSFSFDVAVKEGAGAFVCGEETALIESVEGGRGMPRVRPPFPAQAGLWDKPTNINNVETLANVPWIIRHGAEAFAAMGTEKSSGTKVFALAGDIKRGGLVEVPMGITLREIITEIGGGTASGAEVKAVQLGGPSGGCIPEHLMDTVVDYDAVNATGAIMGSGGMVVMDVSSCMVDIARFFLQFTQNESCGKCTFCRIGTKRMLEILTRITEGEGEEADIERLLSLSERVKASSLCGLGQTAPNPVLTTLRYFREEYEAHIRYKRCHAGTCRSLITYAITDKCTGCGACVKVCPVDAIAGERKKKHTVVQEVCIRCGACKQICPFDAVEVK